MAGRAANKVERGIKDTPSQKAPRRKKRLIKKESAGQMAAPGFGGMGVGMPAPKGMF
jgi:hypothetical protein